MSLLTYSVCDTKLYRCRCPLRSRFEDHIEWCFGRFAHLTETAVPDNRRQVSKACLRPRGYYGLALSYCGRWEEGDLAVRRALRLSPHDPLAAFYCGIAAYAQFVGRNYGDAIRLARDGIRQRADFVGAHRVLTAAAAMAGEDEVARSSLRELRRLQPGISVDWITEHLPIRREADREHYLEAFRRAGMDTSADR